MTGPDFRVDGRVALITGAGRGMGLSIARALAAQGAAVAIQDIEKDVAEAEVDTIRKEGGKAIALGGDLSDISICQPLVDQTISAFGGFHILVNNGAIQIEKPWREQTPDDMLRVYRANNMTPLILAQIVAPIFVEQKWGRILNIGSIQQRGGAPIMLPYAMTKAALVSLNKVLARDLAPHGNITVNLIAPGVFATYRNRRAINTDEDKERMGKWIPSGRVGEPDDVVGAAVMLCSNAASYITGQDFFVDGGMSTR